MLYFVYVIGNHGSRIVFAADDHDRDCLNNDMGNLRVSVSGAFRKYYESDHKNSIAVMVMNKSWSLLLLVIFVAAAALFLLVPPAAIFVPAFYMWVDNKILERIFRKYMRKEDLEKQIELDRAKSGMI